MKNAKQSVGELFMQRALDLALLGRGSVSPNPCVGCVIVANGKIIGEGWHQKYGGPHAEVNAIMSIAENDLLKESAVYVTLEPCSHHGKTPPCADLLIQSGVKKVIIGTIDSNPLVGGRGIQKLRDAGIEVQTGVLEKESRELNMRFFTFIEKKRPFIILKWARTADGFIAREDLSSKWISDEFSRKLVHRWRSEEDAVMVGTTTAAYDNPALTVRDWTGRNPVRVVIDRFCRLSPDLQLFDRTQETICYNTIRSEKHDRLHFVRLDESEFIHHLVRDLYDRDIESVIVDGGRTTINLFIQSGLWDEARIFSSTLSFGSGIDAPVLVGNLVSREQLVTDTLEIFTPWIK